MAGRIYAGTSGWIYGSWRAHLYADTPVRRWLHVASHTFSSLEINGSFYSQIAPATYQRWRDETPRDFRFALKGHRFVTHYKRLRDCEASIIRLRDQASHLGSKLAAVLWQLPSTFEVDLERLEGFLDALRTWRVRHAIELRHRSWFTAEVAMKLRDAGVAACWSDAPDFPMWREVTADFAYVRLHGHTRKYASSYSTRSLQQWAKQSVRWRARGLDVFVYFDNDAEGHAVRNARAFEQLTGGRAPPTPPTSRTPGPAGRAHRADRHL
ncbi:MAG: DUF72 domain-containing protein [Kofleriaceae bacterium]